MNCPRCQCATIVKDSRPSEEGAVFRRRRRCGGCGFRFTTYEHFVDDLPAVRLRADGCVEPHALSGARQLLSIMGRLETGDMQILLRLALRLSDDVSEPVSGELAA